MRPVKFFLLIILFGLFAGCTGQGSVPETGAANPTPTALPLFAEQGSAPGSSQPVGEQPLTNAPGSALLNSKPVTSDFPTLTPYPTATWLPTQVPPTPPIEVPIYGDALSSGWQLTSPGNEMDFDLNSRDQVHSGNTAIAITPNKSHGKIYIVAADNNTNTYLRSKVLGLRFWLYSGERGLDQYDLAVTAIGSNVYTYWREDDFSVIAKTPYEETFLRWLGYDQNIPPFTWVPVQIWLDEMRFDPDYKYVTGLYITNRQGFTRTFYIDDISLQLPPNTPKNTSTPTTQP